jgi:hypothetical protein
MQSTASSYLLIFRESTPERYQAMSADERREALDHWNAWCDRLSAAGVLQSGNALFEEGRIISGASGGRAIDGPFAEAKELIGGYFLITAASLDEATEIARQSPNLPYGMTVEVRPIAGACHLARSLGMSTMREAPTAV